MSSDSPYRDEYNIICSQAYYLMMQGIKKVEPNVNPYAIAKKFFTGSRIDERGSVYTRIDFSDNSYALVTKNLQGISWHTRPENLV